MAIKYDRNYNKKINKDVRHFNQVRDTLAKKGIKTVPKIFTVSDLKARYTLNQGNKRQLNKELQLLRSLSSKDKDLIKEVENKGGAKSVNWMFKYLKTVSYQALEYYTRQRDIYKKKLPLFPGEKGKYNDLERKVALLNMDINYMNQEQFNEFQSTALDYLTIPGKIKGGYKGFLVELQQVMNAVGYSKSTINKLFKKLSQLQPHQFHKLYEENSLISRIYELYMPSTSDGEFRMNLPVEQATELVDELLQDVDDLVDKYSKF